MLVIGLAALALLGPGTSLTVTVWPRGTEAGGPQTWRLQCGPPGGTLPRAAAACRQLAAARRPFAPIPSDRACTEIFGGPEQALVRGRHAGRRVWARFDRRNGCQIARWDQVRLLFPIRAGAP